MPGDVLRLDVASGEVTALTRSAAPIAGFALAEPRSIRIPTPDGEEIPCFVYGAPRAARTGWPDRRCCTSTAARRASPSGSSARSSAGSPWPATRCSCRTCAVPSATASAGTRSTTSPAAQLGRRPGRDPRVAARARARPVALGAVGRFVRRLHGSRRPRVPARLWAAGVDIVGISSLVTFLENTSAYRRAYREREYGSLDRDRDFLAEASPLTHIDDMRAPLFVIHGANDPRVPLSRGRAVKAALAARAYRASCGSTATRGTAWRSEPTGSTPIRPRSNSSANIWRRCRRIDPGRPCSCGVAAPSRARRPHRSLAVRVG